MFSIFNEGVYLYFQTEYEKSAGVEMYYAGCVPEDLTCPAETDECKHTDDDTSCSGCCDEEPNCNVDQLNRFKDSGAASVSISLVLIVAMALLSTFN